MSKFLPCVGDIFAFLVCKPVLRVESSSLAMEWIPPTENESSTSEKHHAGNVLVVHKSQNFV